MLISPDNTEKAVISPRSSNDNQVPSIRATQNGSYTTRYDHMENRNLIGICTQLS